MKYSLLEKLQEKINSWYDDNYEEIVDYIENKEMIIVNSDVLIEQMTEKCFEAFEDSLEKGNEKKC